MVLGVLAFAVGCAPAPAPLAPTLKLSTLFPTYPAGVAPFLQVKLALGATNATWWVTTFDYGSVSVVKLTRDGTVVKPSIAPVDFVNDPKAAREAALVTLSSGKEVSIPFSVSEEAFSTIYRLLTVEFDSSSEPVDPRSVVPKPPTNIRAQRPVPPADPRAVILLRQHLSYAYDLTRPGTYVLKVRYVYSGRRAGEAGVFSEAIESNEISFTLQ
jgi:hypothetical protein